MNSDVEHERAGDGLLFSDLEVPWHTYVVPALMSILLILLWALLPTPVMSSWALSQRSVALAPIVIVLHMFAHGGFVHVVMNVAGLMVVGPRLIARIGSPPVAWARFLYVFVGSGLAGGATFLALAGSSQSALGSSGAIFGLLGALARVHPATGEAVSILSRRSGMLAFMFVRDHLIMFALIFVALLVTGHSAMVAWEAHLGGTLFGLFISSLFLPARNELMSQSA